MDGQLVWKKAYGEEFWESYPGSRSTPVIAGDQIYILSGKGLITCLDANTGADIWKKDLFKEYGGRNIRWGITEMLIIHGNSLICTPGGKEHNIIALDRRTGKLIWTCKAEGEKSAYCSPLLVDTGNMNLLVTHTENNILGIDADKGQLLWTYSHTNRYSIHPNTPLYFNEHVFCFSGYGRGGVMLQLLDGGRKIKKKWFTEDLDSRMGGAVFVNGYMYGSGDENRAWQCFDWVEGNQRYESKELGKGAIITADDMLYCYSERGELALVKADPSGFHIVSECKVTLGKGQHWAHPVIDDGILYVRHGNVLIAYKIR
jgi:outer membrane protein assembly factor BamB